MASQTATTTAAPGSIPLSTPGPLPIALPSHILSKFPALTPAQAGHLRHFHNLATQLDGEWRHMGAQDPGQEWLDAYRYQLATMAYAAGAAHYHRLPALRSVFRVLLEQLIHKMLRREVWGYWYLTSQSGRFVDPDIEELRKPWSDPIKRENIMYSGHLLLMVSLHAMLFDDDKYDQPDALVFDWNPIFWGMGPEKFCYSRSSLQKAILDEMERTNWMGVCCEPNSVFVVCNQFPLIAIRYNDVRNGTNVIDGVLDKYRAAWDSRNGFTQGGDQMVAWWRPKQQDFVPGSSIGFSSWASAFMNAWNPSYCHAMYPSFALGNLTRHPSGRVNLNPPAVAAEIRALVHDDPATDPHAPATLDRARGRAAEKAAAAAARQQQQPPGPPKPPASPEFGYVVKWVISPVVKNLPAGLYGIYEGGKLVQTRSTGGGDGGIDLELQVGGDELDVVLLKQK
ncbi:putative linalool dehydratase-isomerase precursor protein [Neofusicoccum parvum UCRNP2]|uniref:Putative linalool dehydratase-isomerase protein n=1 Tax=Botryosphaeria parva (strain UCR-NP2) TaxID=1287680 RepID=R1E9L4_BOTPV|nr:putative linalool dehydratase-isomerase precursor protein [Neofusicoccum parvum UCRNP2]